MKFFPIVLGMGFILAGMSITSCQKTNPYINPVPLDTTTSMVSDNIDGSETATDASISSEASIANPNSPANTATPSTSTVHFIGYLGDSVTITPQTQNSPGMVQSNFGKGVTLNGITRSGMVVSYFWNKYYTTGFKDSIIFQNYIMQGKSVRGHILLVRLTDSSLLNIAHINYNRSGGSTNTFDSRITRSYNFIVSSAASTIPATYVATEIGTTINMNGSSGVLDTAHIISPLIFNSPSTCSITGGIFPVKGTINLSSSAYQNHRIVDFGTGTCDLMFTVTIGSIVETIVL